MLILFLLICCAVSAPINLTQFWKSELQRSAPLEYEAFAGYESVDWYRDNAKIFYTYWGVSSRNMNDTDVPLIIFLQGGPGASSQFSAFNYIGPLKVIGKNESMHLQQNKFSWNLIGNLLVIDQPVNTGFSYDGQNYNLKTTQEAGAHFINFLYNFFQTWGEETKAKNIYMAGESYAGHYLPVFGEMILTNKTLKWNLKGISIGGAYVDSYIQDNYVDSFLHSQGIVDPNGANFCQYYQTQSMVSIKQGKPVEANKFMDYITNTESVFQEYYGGINIFNVRQYDEGNCNYDYDSYLEKIKSKLGVPENIHFIDQNDQIYASFSADLASSKEKSLIYCADAIKVMIYNGQNDAVVTPAGIITFLNSWNWRYKELWKRSTKQILQIGSQTYGWRKRYGRFAFVLINNSGHFVPADQPRAFFNLFNEWIAS